MQRFQSQPSLLKITGNVVIVGDIHGNLQDLVRILRRRGLDRTYVFLGDYVDRGDFSLEVILFLFTLTCKYPDRFFLLRGNHECRTISSRYGFKLNVLTLYSEALFDRFMDIFDWLPLAAVINHSVFCVHGGITPDLHSLSQIAHLRRPLDLEATATFARKMLWADPTLLFPLFSVSDRSDSICEYGVIALRSFLNTNGLKVLVRAHQCVPSGVQFLGDMPVMTVFSSSNYYDAGSNSCGILAVTEENELQPDTLEPLQRTVKREDVSFFTITRAPENDMSQLPFLVRLPSRPGIVAPGLLRVSVNMLSSAEKNFLARKNLISAELRRSYPRIRSVSPSSIITSLPHTLPPAKVAGVITA
jgi:protein phosphatase